MDELEERIATLAEADRIAAERPDLDGSAVMGHLGIAPGPDVGAAVKMLLEVKRSEGELSREELLERLDQWWADRSA